MRRAPLAGIPARIANQFLPSTFVTPGESFSDTFPLRFLGAFVAHPVILAAYSRIVEPHDLTQTYPFHIIQRDMNCCVLWVNLCTVNRYGESGAQAKVFKGLVGPSSPDWEQGAYHTFRQLEQSTGG